MKQSFFIALLVAFSATIAGAQEHGKDWTPRGEFDKVKSSLDLSKKQESRLQALYEKEQKEFEKMDAKRGAERPTPPNMDQKNGERQAPPKDAPEKKDGKGAPAPEQNDQMKEHHEKFEANVKEILTEEQFKKWQSATSNKNR